MVKSGVLPGGKSEFSLSSDGVESFVPVNDLVKVGSSKKASAVNGALFVSDVVGVTGVLVDSKISSVLVKSFGCVNCVWRLHGVCGLGFGVDCDSKLFPGVGVCEEYLSFLLGFDDGSANVNVIFERLHLYVCEMQCLDDYKQFLKESAVLEGLRSGGGSNSDLVEKQGWRVNGHRLWWERLNKQVLESYHKVLSRQQPKKLEVSSTRKISLGEIHRLVSDAKRVVEAEVVGGDEE